MNLRVEIIGAGVAGLSIGAMLARQGWCVRIHERADRIREIGAGISLRNNCISVLEHYSIFDELRPHGTLLRTEYSVGPDGEVMQVRDLSGSFRTLVLPRQALVEVLARIAADSGAEIKTHSEIALANPAGWIETRGGQRFEADLVIAADGVGSRIRDKVMTSAVRLQRPTVVDRWLIKNRDYCDEIDMYEYWSAQRRVGIMPAGSDRAFIFLVAPLSDAEAARYPVDVDAWSSTFPRLKRLFQELATTEGSQYSYQVVRCPAWSVGRVALLGDCAHGMPATLGQGAGLTTLNAHALAVMLSRQGKIEAALAAWEELIRYITDATQRWSIRYDQFTNHWPMMLRPLVFGAFNHVKFLNRQMRIADQGLSLFDRRLMAENSRNR